jgi:hypothetical protein
MYNCWRWCDEWRVALHTTPYLPICHFPRRSLIGDGTSRVDFTCASDVKFYIASSCFRLGLAWTKFVSTQDRWVFCCASRILVVASFCYSVACYVQPIFYLSNKWVGFKTTVVMAVCWL